MYFVIFCKTSFILLAIQLIFNTGSVQGNSLQNAFSAIIQQHKQKAITETTTTTTTIQQNTTTSSSSSKSIAYLYYMKIYNDFFSLFPVPRSFGTEQNKPELSSENRVELNQRILSRIFKKFCPKFCLRKVDTRQYYIQHCKNIPNLILRRTCGICRSSCDKGKIFS